MNHKYHAYLSNFLKVAGFIGGALGGAILGLKVDLGQIGFMVGFFGGTILGLTIPDFLFRKVIHATCPKCGGVARQQVGKHYAYLCDLCGHLEKTTITCPGNRSR